MPRTNAGDPARTLALLWRSVSALEDPTRGPRRTLDVDRVVAAATATADAAGFAALSMRRLAEDLGVAPMTLYTYVPGKAELLDLMLDAVHDAAPRDPWPAGQPWPERVRAVAATNRALLTAHPWAAGATQLRPVLGPGTTAKYEHELAAFDGTGLDDVERDAALTHVLTFVRGCVRDATDAAAQTAASGMDDQDWWRSAGPLLERFLDPATYPLATRVGAAAGAANRSAHDPVTAYAFGLEVVLAGLTTMISRRTR